MNEGIKREPDSEALSPNLDRFHDSGVFQLLRHQTIVERVGALAGVGLNTSSHKAPH